MYRLLETLRQLEQKQVSEKAMLPMKDTRELLYRMLKAGTISLQVHAPLAQSLRARLASCWYRPSAHGQHHVSTSTALSWTQSANVRRRISLRHRTTCRHAQFTHSTQTPLQREAHLRVRRTKLPLM